MLDLTPRARPPRARGLTADAKQKISLGRGLVRADVAAVLFDEPLTVIDPAMKWELRSKLKAVHRALDLLMIYVTHDQTEALTFADLVVVMNEGRVLQIGTPAELFDTPAHTFVGYFIGSPGMNLLPATVQGRQASVDGSVVDLQASYPAISGAEIGIRPEFVSLAADGRFAGADRPYRGPRPPPPCPREPRGASAGRDGAAGLRAGGGSRLGRVRPGANACVPRQRARRRSPRMKPLSNRAWFLVIPVMIFVLFSSVIPMMTVVNYSVQDSMGQNSFFWNGSEWFQHLFDPSAPTLAAASRARWCAT